MITHHGTPEAERCAALKRLEALLGHRTDKSEAPLQPAMITRSVRIGHRRRPTAIDEFVRLELYTPEHTYGDVIRDIYLACQASNAIPFGVDFGFHQSDEAVIAIRFRAGMMGDPMDFQSEIRHHWPKARVTLSTQEKVDERILLLYLGVHQCDQKTVSSNVG
ncbi:MAG: hypothetical protein H6851_06855 [Geminicoccaceae bacterium]|nr:hypothetical protein [Geminicoccaceae bacterium]